jgi:L-lactate dehydrogenase complex protein LldE
MSPATSTRPKVALFATCYNDTVWPGTPIATVKVLERLGCEVVFPEAQTCCGQIFTNTGYADEAIPLVRGFVDTFGGYDYVVAPSGSCVGAIREQHHDLAERAGDAALVRRVDSGGARRSMTSRSSSSTSSGSPTWGPISRTG